MVFKAQGFRRFGFLRFRAGLAAAVAGLVICLPGWDGSAGQASARQSDGEAAGVVFRDITRAAGLDAVHVNGASPDKYFPEIMGSGGLFFDADADGWVDVFLVDGGSIADPAVAATAAHRLYRNRRDGTYEDVTAASGIRHREYGMGACAGDYDNDGLVDLYVTNYGPNLLYRNLGDARFEEVPAAGGADSALWSTSCAFTDVDADGFLDLFVTNYVQADSSDNRFCGLTTPRVRAYCHPLVYPPLPNVLYRNTGTGTFEDISAQSGVGAYRGNGLGVSVADVDQDGRPDIFVANDGTPNFLFHNRGQGRFEEIGLLAGVSTAADGKARAGMGAAFGDFDGDGRFDLVVTNHEFEMHTLFRNLGDLVFTDVTLESGLGPATLRYVGFGVAFVDYDNDGWRDLAIVNGNVMDNVERFRTGARHAQRNLLLRNERGRLRDVTEAVALPFMTPRVSRTLAAGDIDNDGDVDLLVTNNGGPARLLRNDGGHGQPAITVRVIGTASNRDGLGARLRVTAGGRTFLRRVASGSSYLGQNDLRVHVGLDRAAAVDRLEILWPGGAVDVLEGLPAGHIYTVREGDGEIRRDRYVR